MLLDKLVDYLILRLFVATHPSHFNCVRFSGVCRRPKPERHLLGSLGVLLTDLPALLVDSGSHAVIS